MTVLYENIKRECQARGLNFAMVEKAAGFTHPVIYRWGSLEPGVNKVAAVARVLGVPIESLLEGSAPLEDLEALPAEAIEADPEEPIKGQIRLEELQEEDLRYEPAEYIP